MTSSLFAAASSRLGAAALSLVTACGAALLLAAPQDATAQQKAAPLFTLRTAHYFKEDHPWHKGLAFFARKVSDDSGGRIQIDIFSGPAVDGVHRAVGADRGRRAGLDDAAGEADPGGAGHRAHPHTSESAGPCAATGASARGQAL